MSLILFHHPQTGIHLVENLPYGCLQLVNAPVGAFLQLGEALLGTFLQLVNALIGVFLQLVNALIGVFLQLVNTLIGIFLLLGEVLLGAFLLLGEALVGVFLLPVEAPVGIVLLPVEPLVGTVLDPVGAAFRPQVQGENEPHYGNAHGDDGDEFRGHKPLQFLNNPDRGHRRQDWNGISIALAAPLGNRLSALPPGPTGNAD